MRSDKHPISILKFLPVYILEIVVTSSSGVMSTAVANHLISELFYEPWVGGLIVSLASIGFTVFTLAFGHISDRFGQRLVISAILILRLIFSVYFIIPITSNMHLVVFGIVFFFDGAVMGVFWPTIQQISVLTENYGGKKLKQKYMSGYNFSWNFGYIFGMLIGAFIVYVFGSN